MHHGYRGMIQHLIKSGPDPEYSMPTREFEDLVRRFAEREERAERENVVDWQELKTWWTRKVTQLFDQIEAWLRPLIDSGVIKSARSLMQLTEQDIGQYDVESLRLQLASQKLTLRPEGTMLVGAYGRIEVSGPTGKIVLLLRDADKDVPLKEKRAHVEWFIARPIPELRSQPRNRQERRPLTEESFQQMFTDLFGISR